MAKKPTKPAVKEPAKAAPKSSAHVDALNKLSRAGGSNSQWRDAWAEYKDAAGI